MKSFIENSAKNAQYTSIDIQNEIIDICGEIINDQIISEVKSAGMFTIMIDEASDITQCEQLSLNLRYYKVLRYYNFEREVIIDLFHFF